MPEENAYQELGFNNYLRRDNFDPTTEIDLASANQVFPSLGITDDYVGEVGVDKLITGTIESQTITLAVQNGEGDVYIASGKTDFTNTDAGFILGVDDSAGDIAKFYVGDSSSYINWDGSSLTIVGGLNVDELHIPDADSTANSFHVNTTGDAWWGATETNFNSNNDNANAYVLKTGVAKFQTITLTGSVILSGLQVGSSLDGTYLANLSVDTAAIAANAIEEAKIAADAVTAAKIAVAGLDGTSGDVSANHIIAGMLQSNSVTTVKLNADSVTAPKINVVGLNGTTGRIVVADATDANTVTSGINDYASTNISAGKIIISGGTNLEDWRKSDDLTAIDGGQISTNTVTATQINVTNLQSLSTTTGTLTVDSSGYLRSTGATYFGGTPGFWMGYDTDAYKFHVGDPAGDYILWDGSSLTIVGGLSVDEIHIGGDDATSAHIDTDGNFWTGASVANKATAPARISNAGDAVFESIQVGGATRQYAIGDAGLFNYGDGSDGDVTVNSGSFSSGPITSNVLTRDAYFDTLTLNGGDLKTDGFRLFCRTAVIVTNGTIKWNGNVGGAGDPGSDHPDEFGGAGGTGGAADAGGSDAYLKGWLAGEPGGVGGVGATGAEFGAPGAAGDNGVGLINSIGNDGTDNSGSKGGDGDGNGGAGGTGGIITEAYVKLIAGWHLQTLLDINIDGSTVKFDNSGSSGGGGGGGGGGGSPGVRGGGGGGGGSGTCGGMVAIYAKTITVGGSGLIQANGGVGGVGGKGGNGNELDPSYGGGGGQGGAGGNGGQLLLVYNSFSNSGTVQAIGGVGGAGGIGGTALTASGETGDNGVTGTAGDVRQFQLSL